MFKSLWRTLEDECSGTAAYQAIADISRYHRIQASPGYRQAAEYVYRRLTEANVQVKILDYPANTDTTFWGARSFQEWNARTATLHLIEPQDQARKLADYREVPISLIQRSVAFDGEAKVVAVERGDTAEEYEGLDVAGKIVLARGRAQRVYDLAVRRRGALGIIFDGMAEVNPGRPAWALPDAIQYTSFWWSGDEPKCFGFALSPREGERLRRLIQKRQKDGAGPVRVRAHVDAHLYDGTLQVVSAVIPGEIDEEIVLVGHLCHPQPSCNDNASGAAAVLEVARALQTLIDAEKLARPRRTIRFLWVPEMTGTYAFLAANESRIPHMVAGLNLDMVGQDQVKCGSSFLLEYPPESLPSFAPVLLTRLREMLLSEVKTYTKLGGYPTFRHAVTPFSGGSDHYIFSDPSVGVPMPMIIQWPDKFYHTTADTLDKVDPAMLGKTCVLTAAYAYWLAQAGEPESRWLASEMSARFRQQIIRAVQKVVTDVSAETNDKDCPTQESLCNQLEYQTERHQQALASLTRLASIDTSSWQANDATFAETELNRVVDTLPHKPDASEVDEKAARLVPQRLFRGPLGVTNHVSRMAETKREEWWKLNQRIQKEASWTIPELAMYWADGQRTVAEISQQVALETGLNVTDLLVEYFCFAEQIGLLELEDNQA
ncbi:MAG: DUF4910 domain-containing protein [Chloroflexi bacterium]|nr:DUF4910 domain-containing protein [Chloroflexota bacterium]